MKILYVCGTYCPSHGGAEISMHTLLKFFKKSHQAKILTVTDYRYTKNKKKYVYDSIPLIGISHSERGQGIEKAIRDFNPDIMVTQLMWSDVALRIGKKMKIPTILRVCKVPFELDISKNSNYAPSGLICVSKAVKKYVEEKWKRKCQITIPLIDLNKNILVSKEKSQEVFDREYILMFNPLKRKGGEIFKELAEKNPLDKFAVVLGWSSLKENNDSKVFSNKMIRRMCESQGTKFIGKKPEYVDLSNIKNVKLLKSNMNVSKIYSKTKILLIPSQWEEAFGRVAIEGMANGIPIIGSGVGGLKEAIGRGGIIIKDYSDSDSWSVVINKLKNKKFYNKVSLNGKKWVEKNYKIEAIVNDSYLFFLEILNKFKQQ